MGPGRSKLEQHFRRFGSPSGDLTFEIIQKSDHAQTSPAPAKGQRPGWARPLPLSQCRAAAGSEFWLRRCLELKSGQAARQRKLARRRPGNDGVARRDIRLVGRHRWGSRRRALVDWPVAAPCSGRLTRLSSPERPMRAREHGADQSLESCRTPRPSWRRFLPPGFVRPCEA